HLLMAATVARSLGKRWAARQSNWKISKAEPTRMLARQTRRTRMKLDTFRWLERSMQNARARLATGKPRQIDAAKVLYPNAGVPAKPKRGQIDQSATAQAAVGPRNTTPAVW